jgi:hypothetical protein
MATDLIYIEPERPTAGIDRKRLRPWRQHDPGPPRRGFGPRCTAIHPNAANIFIESERQLSEEAPAAWAQAWPRTPGGRLALDRRARKYRRAARLGCNGAQWSPVVRQQQPRALLEDTGLQSRPTTDGFIEVATTDAHVWLDGATIRFRFFGPSSFNTALQLVLRPHFLVHFV